MWKNKIRGYAIVEYRHLLLMRAAIVFFMLSACLLLVRSYTADFEVKSEAAQPAYQVREEDPYLQGMKDSVLDWMKKNSEMPDEILSRIYDEASKNPNSDLLLAVCKVESNFNPNIKSSKEALGLMGVRPGVWLAELKEKGMLHSRRDLYLIRSNLSSGAYVLQKYLFRRGSLEEALNDYVGGDAAYARKVVQALGEIYTARMAFAKSRSATIAKIDRKKEEMQTPQG